MNVGSMAGLKPRPPRKRWRAWALAPRSEKKMEGVGFSPAVREKMEGAGFSPAIREKMEGAGFSPAKQHRDLVPGFAPLVSVPGRARLLRARLTVTQLARYQRLTPSLMPWHSR